MPKLLSLGRDMAGLSLAETRIVHDFAVRSAADILDRHFKGDLTKALFGFDGVVGNFASPQSPGHRLCPASSSVRRSCRCARRVGTCDRRDGLDYPGHGPRVPRSGSRHPARPPGRGDHRQRRPRGGRSCGRQSLASANVVAGVNPKLLFDRLVPHGAVDADVASRMHGWKCESATFRMNVALVRTAEVHACCRRRAIT